MPRTGYTVRVYRATTWEDANELRKELEAIKVISLTSPEKSEVGTYTDWIVSVKTRAPRIEQVVRNHQPHARPPVITPVKGGFSITQTIDPLTGQPWEPGEGPNRQK